MQHEQRQVGRGRMARDGAQADDRARSRAVALRTSRGREWAVGTGASAMIPAARPASSGTAASSGSKLPRQPTAAKGEPALAEQENGQHGDADDRRLDHQAPRRDAKHGRVVALELDERSPRAGPCRRQRGAACLAAATTRARIGDSGASRAGTSEDGEPESRSARRCRPGPAPPAAAPRAAACPMRHGRGPAADCCACAAARGGSASIAVAPAARPSRPRTAIDSTDSDRARCARSDRGRASRPVTSEMLVEIGRPDEWPSGNGCPLARAMRSSRWQIGLQRVDLVGVQAARIDLEVPVVTEGQQAGGEARIGLGRNVRQSHRSPRFRPVPA